jgi:hypothetical protein
MTRSRRQAENGLISGYKKAEEVARKKVVIEVSVFLPSPQGLRRGKQCSPLPLRFRRDFRFAPTGFSFLVFFLTPDT